MKFENKSPIGRWKGSDFESLDICKQKFEVVNLVYKYRERYKFII